jgi:hypothetical protein
MIVLCLLKWIALALLFLWVWLWACVSLLIRFSEYGEHTTIGGYFHLLILPIVVIWDSLVSDEKE